MCVLFVIYFKNGLCGREETVEGRSYREVKLSVAVEVKCMREVKQFFSVSTHSTDEIMWY